MKIWSRLKALISRRKLEHDMAAELQAHIDMQEAANRAAGMSSQEAHYAARRQFGHLDCVKETVRDQRNWTWLESWLKDFRFAARSLAKSPGFTLTVVATLAIGIGATTAFVSLALRVLWPKLPYPNPGQLVMMDEIDIGNPDRMGFITPRLAYFRTHATSFSGLATENVDCMNLVVDGAPTSVTVGMVTEDFFGVLGIQPALGRSFLPSEFEGDSGEVVVLSHDLWRNRFSSDSNIVGRDVRIGERMRRVIGVMPPSLRLPEGFDGDLYLPMTLRQAWPKPPFAWYKLWALGGIGRLRPGVERAQAQAEIDALTKSGSHLLGYRSEEKIRLSSFNSERYESSASKMFGVFFGSVFLLHAIACTNAANLILVRSLLRRRELAVRLALGGSCSRIIRLILLEALLLTAAAAAMGLLMAKWCWSFSTPLLPIGAMVFADLDHLGFDRRTLCAAALLCSVTCVLVTLIPAWRVTRANVNDTLKEGAGSLGDSQRLGRLRNSFVALQVALAVILLLSAGLMFRAFRRLQDAGVGFDPTNKLVVSLQLPEETSGQTISEDSAHLLERFQRLPWVAQVARGSGSPLQNGWTGGVKVDDRPGLGEIRCSINAVSAGYFSTMGIPFRAGRGFEGLRLGDPEVVVINETSVKRWFPGESPLGKRITYDGKTTMEIIGVVADIRDWRAQDPISPHIYLPTWQPPDSSTSLTFVLRLSGPAGLKFDEAIRRAAYEADPHIIVLQVSKLEDEVYQRVYLERSAMDLLKAVSILSVVLAAVGLFAVMAYAVAQRKREYGVRMALGASPENLQWFVLRNGMKVTLVGISIGLCAAWGLTRLLQSILFETSPHDPFAYVGSAVALFGVAALACWLPARRAANVDPVEALRAE